MNRSIDTHAFYDWAQATHPDLVASFHRERIATHSAGLATATAMSIATEQGVATALVRGEDVIAAEVVPTEPAAQVDWIASRARDDLDVSKEALAAAFEVAGQAMSTRTIQRRLAAAREQEPAAFAAA